MFFDHTPLTPPPSLKHIYGPLVFSAKNGTYNIRNIFVLELWGPLAPLF